MLFQISSGGVHGLLGPAVFRDQIADTVEIGCILACRIDQQEVRTALLILIQGIGTLVYGGSYMGQSRYIVQ